MCSLWLGCNKGFKVPHANLKTFSIFCQLTDIIHVLVSHFQTPLTLISLLCGVNERCIDWLSCDRVYTCVNWSEVSDICENGERG